jgi:hypothetical protein
VLVVVTVLVVVLVVADPFSAGPSSAGITDNADATSTATVITRTLSSQTQVDATLGYAGSYDVVNEAMGTITSLPAVGQVISQGQILYEVDGAPVVLLYGSTPAYRTLAEGSSATAVTGADVAELNDDLVALGYVTTADLGSGGSDFSSWTKVGVEALQKALGVTQNGTLSLGQVVFLPTAARITALGADTIVGGQAQPGSAVLSATSTTRVVTLALDATEQSQVAVGDRVSISLPDNQTTPGVISSVGTVATTPSGGGNPTVTVLVTPTDPTATGSIDEAPVVVSITTASVNDALVVPVDSLLALASGGYAIEVVSARRVHSLVPVTLGLFDDADGLVQVSGSAVHAGQRIVVPVA